MDYEIINENEIDKSLEEIIKNQLCICFPKDVNIFSEITYWHSIPSYRILGKESGEVVSHIAVVDRMIKVAGEQFHIAGIQSVFVLPEYRGKDITEKMFFVLIKEARQRHFDFSILFCIPKLEKFYCGFGYKKINDRQIEFINEFGQKQKLDDREIALWRPVCKANYPEGNINLNGDKW